MSGTFDLRFQKVDKFRYYFLFLLLKKLKNLWRYTDLKILEKSYFISKCSKKVGLSAGLFFRLPAKNVLEKEWYLGQYGMLYAPISFGYTVNVIDTPPWKLLWLYESITAIQFWNLLSISIFKSIIINIFLIWDKYGSSSGWIVGAQL